MSRNWSRASAPGSGVLAQEGHRAPVGLQVNEYANLIGGKLYEPEEENPMLGFRGASRYISDSFRDCFELECRAMKKVRDVMGLTNVELMVPFVRTLGEASGCRSAGEVRAQAWREWPAGHHDVRAAVQRSAG